MLKLNKLEKQTITPVPQKYDLCAQLCECALQFEHVWEEKGIELEADLEEHAVIEGDEELLALVWTNLLSNAIKFTPPGGTITHHQTTLHLKRDRKIINKMELTRLQRHFEACINEIKTLESSKTQMATVWALVVAVVGTAFMAGSTFAVVHEPPIIWLCILLAIPGFIGWILPWSLYQRIRKKQTEKLQPLIEAKQEEIYEICEKGHSLL